MRVSQRREFEDIGIEPYVENNKLLINAGFTTIGVADHISQAMINAGMKSRRVGTDNDGEIYEITDVENPW
jgi:hypothetical protein